MPCLCLDCGDRWPETLLIQGLTTFSDGASLLANAIAVDAGMMAGSLDYAGLLHFTFNADLVL